VNALSVIFSLLCALHAVQVSRLSAVFTVLCCDIVICNLCD